MSFFVAVIDDDEKLCTFATRLAHKHKALYYVMFNDDDDMYDINNSNNKNKENNETTLKISIIIVYSQFKRIRKSL
jgi:hemoglobin-like flavoprotein